MVGNTDVSKAFFTHKFRHFAERMQAVGVRRMRVQYAFYVRYINQFWLVFGEPSAVFAHFGNHERQVCGQKYIFFIRDIHKIFCFRNSHKRFQKPGRACGFE